jgi:hypothetical protein
MTAGTRKYSGPGKKHRHNLTGTRLWAPDRRSLFGFKEDQMTNEVEDKALSKAAIFGLGALGGGLPILVSLLAVDLPTVLSDHSLTIGNLLGYAIRVGILLFLGGVVAMLNSDVKQPLSLVQLGIAAPALVSAYINGAPPPKADLGHSYLEMSSAWAGELDPNHPVATAGFFDDVARGIGTNLGVLDRLNRKASSATENAFRVENAQTKTCVEIKSEGDAGAKLTELRSSFPSPAYQVEQGSCAK